MAKQVQSQDIMPFLDKMTDEQIEAAADELHAFVAHRRSNAGKSGAQRAPINVGSFFKHLIQFLQVVEPVIDSLLGAQPGTPAAQSKP